MTLSFTNEHQSPLIIGLIDSIILSFRYFFSWLLVFLAELQTICSAYWNKICVLEGDKFDLERKNRMKDFEVWGILRCLQTHESHTLTLYYKNARRRLLLLWRSINFFCSFINNPTLSMMLMVIIINNYEGGLKWVW